MRAGRSSRPARTLEQCKALFLIAEARLQGDKAEWDASGSHDHNIQEFRTKSNSSDEGYACGDIGPWVWLYPRKIQAIVPMHAMPIPKEDWTVNSRVAYFTVTGVTLVLGLMLSTAAFSQDSADSNANAVKAPSAVQPGAPVTKQHVDGGDLAPNTVFSENYERQPTPASR
jgi:hypothetical protein